MSQGDKYQNFSAKMTRHPPVLDVKRLGIPGSSSISAMDATRGRERSPAFAPISRGCCNGPDRDVDRGGRPAAGLDGQGTGATQQNFAYRHLFS